MSSQRPDADLLAQHEVHRVADGDHQGGPGEAAGAIQLIGHTDHGQRRGYFLQVRQVLAVHTAAGEDHRQGQQKVTQGHIQTVSVERPPHKHPQLQTNQKTGEQYARNQ